MADRHLGSGRDVNLAELRHAALESATAMSPVAEAPTAPVTPGASNWVQLGPLAIPNGQTYGGARVIVTGRVTDIVPHPTDPNTIYVATARGGIWKTTDGGVTWAPMSDNEDSLAIGALAIARLQPQTLYAGTGEGNIFYFASTFPLNAVNASYNGSGILKTTDGGATWTTQGGGTGGTFTGACFYRIAVDPSASNGNTVLAASSLGLYRTTDGGTTWVQLTSGLPPISASVLGATDVVFDPVTPTTAYVAFWGSGIYKSTNVNAASPTWTKLAGGLPTSSMRRIAIAVSPTAPANLYALVGNADPNDTLKGFYVSADGGATWISVAVPGVQAYESYTLHVAVDIATPDVVYLSGVSLYKAVRTGGTWTVTEVGANIHPDNHACASHPTNHLVIYAGSDGGLYRSSDGGATWDDSINEGLCITQFEFIDQHPTSAAVVIGGTQDNGTEQFRNSPAFYHSADGDGGSAGIDQTTPRNVIHTFYGVSPERSTQGGNFGTYTPITTGLLGAALFYPPLAYDQTNSLNVAFGTDRINLTATQGAPPGWSLQVALPGITGRVSAIWYPDSTHIFAGTSAGEVFRLEFTAGSWVAKEISTATLPSRWIWGITTVPGTGLGTVVLGMAGFGTPHVWRGIVTGSGGGASATWSDISGTAPNRLPDVPVNALCIDPTNPNTYYVGTDIGVFGTTNSGGGWQLFSNGLPNTAVYDLLLHAPTRLLRAATHGRGLWERKLDAAAMPDVDIYVRDHIMDTARVLPTPAPVTATYDEPLQNVTLGDQLWWWMCADAKIDSPAPTTHTYQMPVSAVDYLAFETKLYHRDPQRTVTNRVYVQIHNRGIQPATNVTVKILYADASPGLPNLPPDFWTKYPNDSTNTTQWTPIGSYQTIPSISPTRPEILEWDWVPPASAGQHSCLLIVSDCASDPIPAANKVFDVGTLLPQEKRVSQKNLHLIDPVPVPWSRIWISGAIKPADLLRFFPPPKDWSVGILLPKAVQASVNIQGFKPGRLAKPLLDRLKEFLGENEFKLYDPKQFQLLDPTAKVAGITKIPRTKGFDLLLNFTPQKGAPRRQCTLVLQSGERITGGNTFVLMPARTPGK